MANRAVYDEDEFEDGFIDKETGQERILEIETDLGADGFFMQEERKLKKPVDSFAKISYDTLDPNGKRRFTRLSKKLVGTSGAGTKHVNPEEINGYDFYGLAHPPYNLDYLTELAEENPTHKACIVAKTVNIVGLGYQWKETSKIKMLRQNAEEDEAKLERLTKKLDRVQEAMDEWLEDLNEEDDFLDILMKVWMDVEATGNGYLEVGRNRDGTIGYIGHVPAFTVRVRLNRDGFMQLIDRPDKMIFFRNFGDTTTADPLGRDRFPNELMHFKKYSPKNAYYGIPDVVAALGAVAGDKFASSYNLDYFENKAIPRYALIVKGAKLSNAAERKLLDFFKKEVKGKHHGTLYIPVPAPMGSNVDVKLEPLENKVQEGSFTKYREQNRMEIAMVHRTPLSKLTVEGSTATGARESDKTFRTQVCQPEQRRIDKKIRRIIKEKTDIFNFTLTGYDLIDEETKSRIHDRYIRLGVMNADEVRADLGMQPRKGGGKYVDPAKESEAKIKLQSEQAKAATMKGLNDGVTGGDKGNSRKTTEGNRNAKEITARTPKAETSRGINSKNETVDKEGVRASRR